MGAASSLLNTSLRRPVKYHAAKPPTIRTTTARAGAIRGGCRLGRVTGDSVVGPVTWARRKRGRGYKDNDECDGGHAPPLMLDRASYCMACRIVAMILSDTWIILHVCSRFRAKYAEMT